MRAERRRRGQRGQALVEALVAALVLVPLALLAVLLGKFQSMQQATIAASRTLAFECTVRPSACAESASHAMLADEVRRRHFGRIDREILSDDVLDDGAPATERNPLWSDRRGRPLLERFADVGVALGAPRFDAGRSTAVGRASGAAAGLLDRLAGPARFGLEMTAGLADARVLVRVSPGEAGNEQLSRLDSLPLAMHARAAVLTDAWHASGPYGDAGHRVEARVERGSRLDPVHEAQITIGYQLTRWALELMDLAGLEPAASSFAPHHVDVDLVPADRIAP